MYDFGLCAGTYQRNAGMLRKISCGLMLFLPYQHTGTSEMDFQHCRMWCILFKDCFVNSLYDNGLYVIKHFRNDAVLFYLTLEKRIGKRGRPKLYDGKTDFENLDITRST